MSCEFNNSFQLNARINENHPVMGKKCNNVTSLKAPADSVWPKIPLRKISDNISDISEPACEIFQGVTPRKTNSITRPQSMSSNNMEKNHISFLDYQYPKTASQHYAQRRRPGCLDPRFKKVTSTKPQTTLVQTAANLTSKVNDEIKPLPSETENPIKLKRIESTATQTVCVANAFDGTDTDIANTPAVLSKSDFRITEKCEELVNSKNSRQPTPLSKLTIVSNASIDLQSDSSEFTNGVLLNTIPLPVVSYQISPQSPGKVDVTPHLSIYYPQALSASNQPEKSSLNSYKVEIHQKSDIPESESPDSVSNFIEHYDKCEKDLARSSDQDILRFMNSDGTQQIMSTHTQDLLNKSYWEYYKKLMERDDNNSKTDIQFQEELGAPEAKRRRSGENNYIKAGNHPESQTFQQCTVLSSIINNTAETLSTKPMLMKETLGNSKEENSTMPNMTIDKSNCMENHERKQCLSIRIFILCGIAVYFSIILSQTLYENFYHEEHDYLDDLNWIEFALNYAYLSFREAFRQTIDILNRPLLQPFS